MDIKKFFESDFYKRLLMTIGVVVFVIIAFGAGILVGYRKASFSSEWARNYERNFGGPPRMMKNNFMDAHGAIGAILNVASSSIAVNSPDGEKTVLISTSTQIRRDGQEWKSSNLKVNDRVLIIGSPNQNGQVEARFIRVLPQEENNPPR
ncbi:MAG: DUF5666 domain-containing protein [Candidatus Wolfebacteria bacterium]|nr:DUF5666 domain-containing protein [Candidatus Wolfebacteria bacterium]